jgi:2-acylglycerol O-acyltransferase 2
MTKILGVEWAPLNVPWRRRMQTFCVSSYVNFSLFSRLLVFYLLIVTLLSPFWWVTVLYFVWFYFDRNAPKRGGHPWRFFKKSALWKYGAEYFPMSLVKTAELDPQKNYIFGYHPHGIASLGALYNFATFATGFDEKFSNIKMHLCTLGQNFHVPLYREYLLALGVIDVSRESIEYILSRPKPGNAVMIVVGSSGSVGC